MEIVGPFNNNDQRCVCICLIRARAIKTITAHMALRRWLRAEWDSVFKFMHSNRVTGVIDTYIIHVFCVLRNRFANFDQIPPDHSRSACIYISIISGTDSRSMSATHSTHSTETRSSFYLSLSAQTHGIFYVCVSLACVLTHIAEQLQHIAYTPAPAAITTASNIISNLIGHYYAHAASSYAQFMFGQRCKLDLARVGTACVSVQIHTRMYYMHSVGI